MRTLDIKDGYEWWRTVYDANVDASWTYDGKRTYANVLAAAIHTNNPQLSLEDLIQKCTALWEACTQ